MQTFLSERTSSSVYEIPFLWVVKIAMLLGDWKFSPLRNVK